LAQVLLRFIYIIPLVWLALRNGADPAVVGRQLLAGGVALAVMGSSSLAWITLCAEEARDLVEAAPVSTLHREAAKLAVACGLPMLVLLCFLPVLSGFSGRAALLLLLLAPPAALTMAQLQGWHGPRMPRTAFRKRPGALLLMGFTEIILAGCWAALAVMLFSGARLVFIPAILIVVVVAIGAGSRRRPQRRSSAP
jgi:ABC-2 type transport system permease protein